MSAPTWGDLVAFCRADQWTLKRQTTHVIYTKTLADGTALRTEASRGKDSENIGEGLFHFILRVELQVSEHEFWETIHNRKPANRPAHPQPGPVQPRPGAGLVFQLKKYLRMDDEAISTLSRDDAVKLLNEYHSRAPDERPPE